MKNKHLVLLFFAVLALGLLARRLPWPLTAMLQTDLIALDTASVTQINILQNGKPELLLERTDAGWAATQDLRSASVEQAQITPLLAMLNTVRSLRIVKTTRPDTLGFSEKNRLQVLAYRDSKLLEQFEIGNEILEDGQAATFIRLSRHEGIYLAKNHLRNLFSKTLDDFREKTVTRFDPAHIHATNLEWPEHQSVFIQKNDSTGRWESSENFSISNDSMQTWLALFSRFNNSPFADHFDDTRTRETFFAGITLHLSGGDSLAYNVYYMIPPDLPEEISRLKTKSLSPYILHSSQNPNNYFAPTDTLLLRRVCFGLLPLSSHSPKNE